MTKHSHDASDWVSDGRSREINESNTMTQWSSTNYIPVTFGRTIHYGALSGKEQMSMPVKLRSVGKINILHPAFVARRFRESSLSPMARTCPQSAKVVEVGRARPSASTSTMLICTEAWSFDVMRRSKGPISLYYKLVLIDENILVAAHLRGT